MGTLLLVLALPLVASGPAAQTLNGADAEETRERLQQLEKDIARITAAQAKREKQRSSLQAELRRSETALGKLQERQQATRSAIRDNQKEILGLTERQSRLQSAADSQREAVAAEIRQAYKSGGNNQLKLLLSEEDPQRLARMLAYYRYILKARSELLDEFQDTLVSLGALKNDLREKETRLKEQRASLAEQQQALEAQRQERKTLLAQIDASLDSDAANLAAREQDREQLESLLEEIDAALAQLIPEDDVEPFSAARGSMSWPVEGRISNRFGRPRNQGKMRWQGVRMKAEAGSTVTAIHHGRVVYADWLRGSGLLLVLDHGEGYLSLYAHNESLLREVGDWVKAGAPISTVGDSGGQSEAGLYFEIRKDGKPTDPQQWCRG
ncbi:murein hydrolase activator EnvC family protein [Congregibacter litoralis]|uniref:Membrane-bound metallopeptidase n=1 Tax=Congregibacter litoralis KT71 TaxID=314285 RepID=A4A8S7_9GAMM|nr:peptidoglycan DD-metalloendopeptidase family protein [Congregibacter litoralis]EAQ97469.1 Membrane-bound metallopeptidase [Congregibacter litoralis KT71]